MKIEIPYTPHAKQVPFHESKAKYKLAVTGVGFGKTAMLVNELLKMAIEECQPGCQLVLGAPTYRMLKRVVFKEFFKFCPKQIIKKYYKNDMEILLVNDINILGIAGDTEKNIDKVRGITIGGGAGDETGLWPSYFHEVLVARNRDSRGPMRLFYATTPRGFDWNHRVFVKKEHENGVAFKDPENYAVFGGTSLDNPYTPVEYKDSMISKYTGRFAKQEIYGQFQKFEGLVYPEFDSNVHVVNDNQVPKQFSDSFGMIDWGFTNPFVTLFCKVDGDGRMYVLDEVYEKGLTPDKLISVVKGVNERWGCTRFYADPSEADNIAYFNNSDLGCLKANNAVQTGISEVASRLALRADGRPRLYVHRRCSKLIQEFGLYRYKDKKENLPEREEPLKVNDHAMDALRYGVMSRFAADDGEGDYVDFG